MTEKETKLILYIIHQLILSNSYSKEKNIKINEFFLKEFVQSKIFNIFAMNKKEKFDSIIDEVQANVWTHGDTVDRKQIETSINEMIQNLWKI